MSPAPALDLDTYWGPAHSKGWTGAGVKVAVIDTGADSTIYERSRKNNNDACNFVGLDVQWGRIEKKWPSGQVTSDQFKHGSAVFLRLLVGAPSSYFVDVRSLFPDTTEQSLLQSVKSAIADDVDVLNLSLGRLIPFSEAEEHVAKCKVCDFTGRLPEDHDVLAVAAVGNFGNQAIACPGLAPSVLSVGSHLTEDESAYYKDHPKEHMRDFLDGRASTSFATAMACALFAVLRSAFPAIPARDWRQFARTGLGHGNPEMVVSELATICGEWAANFTDWKEFAIAGIKNRRQLLARAFSSGVTGYPDLRAQLADQRDRFRLLVEGQTAFIEASRMATSSDAISQKIKKLYISVEKFEGLAQKARTATARMFLGAALVNRSWTLIPGQMVANDALEADRQLSLAFEELRVAVPPQRAIEGAVLSWRARARTLIAVVHPSKNDEALADAMKGVELLSAEPRSQSVQHDLATAYLHLARAYFFQASLEKKRGLPASMHYEQARRHAAIALELGRTDGYINTDANWLIANAS